MGIYVDNWKIRVDLCGYLWIFVDLCGSLWIFVDICGYSIQSYLHAGRPLIRVIWVMVIMTVAIGKPIPSCAVPATSGLTFTPASAQGKKLVNLIR